MRFPKHRSITAFSDKSDPVSKEPDEVVPVVNPFIKIPFDLLPGIIYNDMTTGHGGPWREL